MRPRCGRAPLGCAAAGQRHNSVAAGRRGRHTFETHRVMPRPEGGQDAKIRLHLTLTRSISSVVRRCLDGPFVTTTEEITVFSFSQRQLAHFQASGFVVARGLGVLGAGGPR